MSGQTMVQNWPNDDSSHRNAGWPLPGTSHPFGSPKLRRSLKLIHVTCFAALCVPFIKNVLLILAGDPGFSILCCPKRPS